MFVSHSALIMVIDGAKMSLFRNRGNDSSVDLELIEQNTQHSASTAELGTDKPGRSFSSQGQGRSAYESTDYHQAEEDEFAKAATEKLNGLAKDSTFDFILIATPQVLGIMRQHYSGDLRNRLVAEVDKNYAGRPALEIAKLLNHFEP